MSIPITKKYLSQLSIMAISLLLLSTFTTLKSDACSYFYLIWMIRDKSADPLYRFVRNGKAGYIDRSGKIIIEPVFDVYDNYGGEFHNGLMLISMLDAKYVDTTGKVVIYKDNYSGRNFSEGLALVTSKHGEKWGFIDTAGEFVIGPRFDPEGSISSFSEGMACIETNKRFGYINRSGEIVIQPTFLYGSDFHDGMARVVVEGPCLYRGEEPCAGSQILPEGKGQAPPCKFTFIDRSGSIISNERYDAARAFSEGLAPIKMGEKWGYIDKNGVIVIIPQFDYAGQFSDELALVQQNGMYGYIDRIGRLVIALQYKYASSFSEGLAVVGNRDDKGFDHFELYFIDKQGKQAIAEKFALAGDFFKGLAHVKLKTNKKNGGDGKAKAIYAYIDVRGNRVFTQ